MDTVVVSPAACSQAERESCAADTMDVYVATNGTVRLMDFNPVGGSTAPLLFEWDELGYGENGFAFLSCGDLLLLT